MKRDEGAGELDQGFVVLDFLLPAHEDAAETIHPANGALHRPSPRAVAGNLLQQFPLGIAGHNVRHITIPSDLAVDRVEVVAFVEPQPLFDILWRKRAVLWDACLLYTSDAADE